MPPREITVQAQTRSFSIMAQREAVIVEAVRTGIGRRNGRLKGWHPVDLTAQVLSALVERTGIDPGLVEDVIVGCVMQVGEQSLNVGRNAVLAAGFCGKRAGAAGECAWL